ncbi:hypothetical protein [Hyphomicrobium facile]|uniref:Uncharacterized protein n=1 Tax=Hyphomicrobium facile TaxID=51670 RepID=A0A1I7N1X6_9HYPH|nr:hypothetical protein [Hyphomicrobium facile]SFV28633.1 hypothetical protein SAMN04488557_1053 [Hyphomicrobium facile]
MSGLRSLPINEMLKRQTIGLSDILLLRRVFYDDGIISADEAEILFALNNACNAYHPEWPEFFIEAITDYIVYQEAPRGYITADNGHWLIDRVSRDGKIDTKTELELIVNVIDKARWAPVSLVKFALEQVKHAVVDGAGPLRDGKALQAGTISEGEVDLLRRMLYAFAGDGNVAVTRAEADVLFDIDEAISASAPNPAWTDLFVKAIANVMMAASGYAVPSREEALRQEATLEEPEEQTSVLAALLSMVQSNLASVQDAYHDQTAEERALARLEHQRIEIITHEEITEAEATWLVSRLGRDGRLSPSEKALVSYLNQESPRIHPVLTEAVCRLGDAA